MSEELLLLEALGAREGVTNKAGDEVLGEFDSGAAGLGCMFCVRHNSTSLVSSYFKRVRLASGNFDLKLTEADGESDGLAMLLMTLCTSV